MAKTPPRIPLRQIPTPEVRLQYLIYPYASFHVGTLGQQSDFKLGPYLIWRDTPGNWERFLGIARPQEHLAMYVDREGRPLNSMWVASTSSEDRVDPERWQHLTASLFYLGWARIPFVTIDRPAAEDLYFEAFVLPHGAETDSSSHVRWSKYGSNYWSKFSIYPAPDVSFRGVGIDLPLDHRIPSSLDDSVSRELFEALDKELHRSRSRLLTALWFLFEACYRAPSRASFAEDIQNICTSFEALLDIGKRGDSANQVSERLNRLFRDVGPSAEHEYGERERQDVLDRLSEWVQALYNVRNDFTHGKPVNSYLLGDRSVWQDAFEVIRLATNRVILHKPERKPFNGSSLEKLMMTMRYFDDAVCFFSEKGDWMNVRPQPTEAVDALAEAIRKARVLDPMLVVSIRGLKRLRDALLHIYTVCYRALEGLDPDEFSDGQTVRSLIEHFDQAYVHSQTATKRLDVDAYIRQIGPRIAFWTPTIPVAGKKILLFELIGASKSLLAVYGQFTTPIVASLAKGLP